MKRFVTIIAAAAALSASLVAGLAATDTRQAGRSPAAAAEPQPRVDGPTRTPAEIACHDVAWPYRPVLCPERNGPARRSVRVILSDAGPTPAFRHQR